MKRTAIVFLLLFSSTHLIAQNVWFQDDFNRNSMGEPWETATGNWKIENAILRISTTDYDQLICSGFYAYATRPFSIEVSLRGTRAGLFFSLDNPSSKILSQMVRFDEKSILLGSFDGAGEFTATSTFDSPKMPDEWTILRVTIDPLKHSCSVFVDEAFVGSDTNLIFNSGYVGLEASDGISEFRSIRISADGPPIMPQLPPIGSPVSLSHLGFIEAIGNDIRFFDSELKKILSVDMQGRLLSSMNTDTPPRPTLRTVVSGRTFSISRNRILITDPGGSLVDSIDNRLISPASLTSDGSSLFVADPGARCIFRFDAAGHLSETIDGSVLGGFKAPRSVARLENGSLAIADYDKIVLWSDSAAVPAAASPLTDGSQYKISWHTNAPGTSWIQYAHDGGTWSRHETTRQGDRASATITNLLPLTRYSYRYGPTLRTIPESQSLSKTFRFATPPADARMTALTRIPVLCIVYRTINYRDRYPFSRYPQIPEGRRLSDDDLEYLRKATEFNREFYFRNSGCKVVLDFDFYVVEDTLWLHEVGETDPYWLPPNDRVTRDFEAAAKHFERKPSDYAGLICPYAWVNYPPRRTSALRDPSKSDSITIRQAVGGGTYGVPAPWKYGTTTGYTSNPFQDKFSRQDWLITHEFHHQIDALMDASGYPEYYHADQPWKMPGRFGEDFDFNARIIRNAPPSSWLTLKFGKLVATLDADQDGVPDDDPSLPFDEKRLGSSPTSQDSDGDGVSDLAEVMMGSSRSSSLTNKDTDGDGLADGVDPEPLYPVSPFIARIADEKELARHPFGSIHSKAVNAQFSFGWQDSAFYFSASTNKPANVLLQIDADNDGWFHGFDNFQIRVLNNGDSIRVADFYLRDCSSSVNPPKDRRDILRITDLGIHSEILPASTDSAYTRRIVLRIPRNERYGLTLKQGKKLSIRLGIQTTTDFWVWEELFERNHMMQVELR